MNPSNPNFRTADEWAEVCERLVKERAQLREQLAKVTEVLRQIKFSRGTDAGSVNAANYTLARETLKTLGA